MSAYKGFHRLPDEDRRKWHNPEAIMADIGLKSGFTFIDVGCSEGFFALPAARLVGENGTVYGLDTDSEAIERLKERAVREGLTNLSLKVGKAEETVLCEKCADIVFMGNDLHDFSEPDRVLVNARKMLKPTGRLVDLDWKKEPTGFGPPFRIRLSEQEAVSLIEEAGFRVETVKEVKPYHYIISAKLCSLVKW